MLKVNDNKTEPIKKSLDDKFMNTLFMKTLSRNDLVGYTMATIISASGIVLMLYIARM